jgi:hypothetical protein
VLNATAFKVVSDLTSQWLLYDFAGIAAQLPPPVWNWLDDQGHDTILGYNPAINSTTPADPDYPVGPRFGSSACPTQLYGTGPFVFVYYDEVAMFTDMPANRHYFRETADVAAQKVTMFHNIGDVNSDGEVWGVDKTRYSIAFGTSTGHPRFDADADITGPEGVPDGAVNVWDGVLISFFWGDQREYP